MTDDRAFLEAIAADPDDEATRLVYADWLEEHGDSRAQFLRLEIEYRKTPKTIGQSKRQLRAGTARRESGPALGGPRESGVD